MYSQDLLQEFEHEGYSIRFYPDTDPESPREWDNLGTMVCFHGRYNLGDKHNFTPESIQYYVKRPDVVALPLYLYDHGGISISTKSFIGRAHHAEWDSGQVGFIFVNHKEIRMESGMHRVSKRYREKALGCLKSEVETYDQFLRGEVYGYEIEDPDGEVIDSCWGYYGYDYEKDTLPELKRVVDQELAAIEKQNAKTYQEEIGGELR